MKKTLVALAALAATGAFAQVSITGNATFGYVATSTPAGDASGFGFDTTEIDFAAKEDLGGGWAIEAKMGLAGADRSGESSSTPYATGSNGPVTGRNASLNLTTPFGLLSMGNIKLADYLSGGVAGVGALYYGMDDAVFGSRTRRDFVTFAVPVTSSLTLAVTHQEGANNLGLGSGATGATSTQQRLNGVVATYKSGGLVVDGQYLVLDNRVDTSNTAVGGFKDVFRLSGSYDAGMVKVGLGTQVKNYNGGAKTTETLLGLSVPLGSLTLGANFAQQKKDDFAANNGTNSGFGLAAAYSMSKRTTVYFQTMRFDSVAGQATASTANGLLLSHSF